MHLKRKRMQVPDYFWIVAIEYRKQKRDNGAMEVTQSLYFAHNAVNESDSLRF